MSMIGEYARLAPAELDRAIRDPEWAQEHVVGLIETGPDAVSDLPSSGRRRRRHAHPAGLTALAAPRAASRHPGGVSLSPSTCQRRQPPNAGRGITCETEGDRDNR
ncbi:DUF1877 family protein [Streptomyces sp. NPDC057496]|uniref:DUF1877 family protein n=1 Tax=Streptomyces sp. NPDC057496 TaxID=3346149 RepID=UPI00369131A4